MRTKPHTFIKYRALICILVLLGSVLACNLPFKIVPNTQDEGQPIPDEEEPFEGEPFGEEEPPPGEDQPGEVWIEFEAERTHLLPGECTLIFWNTNGGYGVHINGEPVERSGEREICLDETIMLVLSVDMGETMEEREIEIIVEGEPGEEQPAEEPPPEEPPPEEPPPSDPAQNDEQAIKQTLLANLGWNESELDFAMGENNGSVAQGGLKKIGEMSGAAWFAGKDNSGQWVIAHIGQGLPLCNDIKDFSFPTEWISHCMDASGNTIER